MNQRFTSLSTDLGNFFVMCCFDAEKEHINISAGKSDSFSLERYKWHIVDDLSFNQKIVVNRLDLNSPIQSKLIKLHIEDVLKAAFRSVVPSFDSSVLMSLAEGIHEDACFSKSDNVYKHNVGNAEVVYS